MSRILVLYTGGTVGCAGEPLAPMTGMAFEAELRARGLLPEFCTLQAFSQPLDSASMQATDWCRIASVLLEAWAAYDGFVILHGTDTLAWTASALSFLLPGVDKPVVLTGAQRALVAPDSDAPRNLADAIAAASTPRLCEVVICFAGRLLRGNRSVKYSSSADDAFVSPQWPALGKIVGGHVRLDLASLLPFVGSERRLSARLPLVAQQVAEMAARIGDCAVWLIHLHPGFPVALLQEVALRQADAPRAWLLACYGAGNIPSTPDFQDALMQAQAAGICMVAVTQVLHGGVHLGAYESSEGLLRAGVVSGEDLSLPAAQAKLQLLLAEGLPCADVLQRVAEPVAGEMRDSLAKA